MKRLSNLKAQCREKATKCLLAVAALWLLFATASSSAGDILFVDINNGVPEINTIEEYLAQQRLAGSPLDTRLVVVPSYATFSRQQRYELELLHAEQKQLFEENRSDIKRRGWIAPDLERQRLASIALIGREIRRLKTGSPDATYSLKAFLSELRDTVENSPRQFDSVIISGHHSTDFDKLNGTMGGEFINGVTVDHVKSILNSAASTRNTSTLILLGCQNATARLMGTQDAPWAGVLPGATLQFGFSSKAPIKSDPNNLSIVKDLMRVASMTRDAGYYGVPASLLVPQVREEISEIPRNGRGFGYRLNGTYYQLPRP